MAAGTRSRAHGRWWSARAGRAGRRPIACSVEYCEKRGSAIWVGARMQLAADGGYLVAGLAIHAVIRPLQVPLWIDLTSVVVAALAGAAVAVEERFDPVGGILLAVIMGLGGGIIRDLLLGLRPVAVTNPLLPAHGHRRGAGRVPVRQPPAAIRDAVHRPGRHGDRAVHRRRHREGPALRSALRFGDLRWRRSRRGWRLAC